jgi:hypothetical protein
MGEDGAPPGSRRFVRSGAGHGDAGRSCCLPMTARRRSLRRRATGECGAACDPGPAEDSASGAGGITGSPDDVDAMRRDHRQGPQEAGPGGGSDE